jgi:hypothetical protein
VYIDPGVELLLGFVIEVNAMPLDASLTGMIVYVYLVLLVRTIESVKVVPVRPIAANIPSGPPVRTILKDVYVPEIDPITICPGIDGALNDALATELPFVEYIVIGEVDNDAIDVP